MEFKSNWFTSKRSYRSVNFPVRRGNFLQRPNPKILLLPGALAPGPPMGPCPCAAYSFYNSGYSKSFWQPWQRGTLSSPVQASRSHTKWWKEIYSTCDDKVYSNTVNYLSNLMPCTHEDDTRIMLHTWFIYEWIQSHYDMYNWQGHSSFSFFIPFMLINYRLLLESESTSYTFQSTILHQSWLSWGCECGVCRLT